MAIIRSKLWYHPVWFARYIPDPDIEGKRLDRELVSAAAGPGDPR
jgi:RND superfamily putative drug exporter